MIDPVLIYAASASLAGILLLGSLSKWRHFLLFEGAVLAYRLLPSTLVKPFSVLFVGAELLAGVMVLLPTFRMAGGWLALSVLLTATLGVAINLLRGHTNVDCGCNGLAEPSAGLSWWLVTRNAGITALIIPILMAGMPAVRSMGWVDVFTFFGATLAVLGLYFSSNQLIDSHTRLQKI